MKSWLRAGKPAAARSPTTWARKTTPWRGAALGRPLGRTRGRRCGHRHRLGLRHDDQGLWPHAAARSRSMRRGRGGQRQGQGHHRIPVGSELPAASQALRVTYHSACSMQHGQKMGSKAADASAPCGLRRVGSSGRPSLLRLGRHLQHPAARDRHQLRDRKVTNIKTTAPQAIATGNIGCITQIARAPTFPSCTRSSCSTGPMAGRSPTN